MTLRRRSSRAASGALFSLGAASLVVAAILTPGDPSTEASLAIRDVTIVDVLSEQTRAGQTILIEGDRILEIGPASQVEIPRDAEVIPGEGRFAVPGLTDLHVHIDPEDLGLFLANGITTIREMNGSPAHLELRAGIRAGERVGPSMLVSGPLVAGIEQQWRHTLLLTPAEARAEVLREHEAGYDFVKVYDGLSAETYEAIVATAGDVGLPVLGHIPEDVGLDRVIADEQLTIEHVEQVVNATVGHELDRAQIPDIVRRIRRGSTAVTPTIAAMEILSSRRTAWFDGLFEREEMRYVAGENLGWWGSLRQPPERRVATADTTVGGSSEWIEFQRELTRALAEAGVPLLVGTDTPNPLLVPGFSLHHELEALVRAGLSSAFVLRAATHGAAVHLNAEDEFGSLRAGLRADITLVDGDPLEDIAHLRSVHGLVLRGEWLARTRLDELLEEVAELRSP